MKLRFAHYFFGFVLLAGGLTAIAEENKVDPLSDPAYKELIASFDKSKDCIFSRTINDWTALDDQRLIVYAPTKKRPYYIKLVQRSLELKFAHTIGVHSRFDNRICPYGGNALFIDGERYTISAIQKLDEDTAKQLLQYQRQKKETKQKQ
ncbi:DUF6491 family protein [Paremcibacter congregatus]|uniref:Uncharacterized protein n=1 Tax=Paremcibacter congregatus TaxID=2043170 RepID=A0A2G4YVB9_9PROT|nr:DUF6491 family protein [Paremcibacter congregatus]PHZ86257.1 hypothetical protein CRD36_06220 [Paremcibacter congregatus]QDE27224.1 hypothetical protein FIV45_07985 [Paremcibacter congregatus]